MILFDDQLSASELSTREHQVLELVACGFSAKQIAQQIEIAPRTVERHIENIRNKLRARNRTHMIAKAVAFGLVHIDRPKFAAADNRPASFHPKPRLVANE